MYACRLSAARSASSSVLRKGMATIVNTVPSSAGVQNPAEYCRKMVQTQDYDAFLTAQFYPARAKPGYLALRAFYIELSTIQESVTSSMLGKMRLQFWRDAIKQISEGQPPRQPIALALHKASQHANLNTYHLKRIIDARDEELHQPVHLTSESVLSHAESTSSTFAYLCLSLLDLQSDNLSHAASHLGKAQSLATLLRALPFHASKGRMVIPAEITAKHGVNQEEVFRWIPGKPPVKGLDDAVFEFATLANDHLLTAREMLKDKSGSFRVPSVAMPVFASGIPIASYLGRLEKANFDAFNAGLQLRDWRLPWRIWRGYHKQIF